MFGFEIVFLDFVKGVSVKISGYSTRVKVPIILHLPVVSEF